MRPSCSSIFLVLFYKLNIRYPGLWAPVGLSIFGLSCKYKGSDPTIPAVVFLKDYCETLGPAADIGNRKSAYYQMLPPFRGEDCMGSTGFFSGKALAELQAPLVVEETLKRNERIGKRFQSDIFVNAKNFPKWIDGSPVIVDHLSWASWLITSRVLTVKGDAEEGKSYRLLIPFLDLCNHDRNSPHILSGRAVPGGELKIIAGASVKAGEAINICYGGGMAGNDRFLQGTSICGCKLNIRYLVCGTSRSDHIWCLLQLFIILCSLRTVYFNNPFH